MLASREIVWDLQNGDQRDAASRPHECRSHMTY